jgi:hypothetical protein
MVQDQIVLYLGKELSIVCFIIFSAIFYLWVLHTFIIKSEERNKK